MLDCKPQPWQPVADRFLGSIVERSRIGILGKRRDAGGRVPPLSVKALPIKKSVRAVLTQLVANTRIDTDPA